MKKFFCVIALAGFCFVGCAPEAATTAPVTPGADSMPATDPAAPATDAKPADAAPTDPAAPPAEAPK